ncbi:MAG TPA: DedA family protein [Candidatus Paceibacterota bacterium]
MLELFVGKIDVLAPIIMSLGIWLYAVIFAFAVFESAPVIGTFTPGTLVLLLLGFLGSLGQLELLPALIFATLGAIAGDSAGYFLGKYGRGFIKENKGLLRTGHLDIGKAYFYKHGGKSVFLGRFVGPIRPIIPLVAGMVHMSFRRFFLLNVSSALLWAALYIALGYTFGNQIELIDSMVSRVGLGATMVVVLAAGYAFHRYRKTKVL